MTTSRLNSIPLFITAYVAVFLAAYPTSIRSLFGVQLDLLPPLMVYCGLNSTWGTLASIALVGGALFDSVSSNPLGVSTLTLFLVGFAIHWNRETILRDQLFAQFVLGLIAGISVPFTSLLILWGFGYTPLVGLSTIWQVATTALVGAVATPVLFWMLGRAKATFNYRSIQDTSFRSDREIKRGRT